MNNHIELINKYDDISTSNKPTIPPYHKDMFIDIEQEYLMRKDLQQRINKAIELLEQENSYCPSSLTLEKSYIIAVEKINKVLNILKGSD